MEIPRCVVYIFDVDFQSESVGSDRDTIVGHGNLDGVASFSLVVKVTEVPTLRQTVHVRMRYLIDGGKNKGQFIPQYNILENFTLLLCYHEPWH